MAFPPSGSGQFTVPPPTSCIWHSGLHNDSKDTSSIHCYYESSLADDS